MNIAICDDEKDTLQSVETLVKKMLLDASFETNEVDAYSDVEKLLTAHEKQAYDVVISDIQMPKMDGFELAQKLQSTKEDIILAFITDHENLVYDSFAWSPVAFIRKSCMEQDMAEGIRLILRKYLQKRRTVILSIRSGDSVDMRTVTLGNISFFSSLKRQTVVHDDKGEYRVSNRLKDLAKQLAGDGFVQSHVSFLVNSSKIQRINRSELLMMDGTFIPISRYRKNAVKEAFLKNGLLL